MVNCHTPAMDVYRLVLVLLILGTAQLQAQNESSSTDAPSSTVPSSTVMSTVVSTAAQTARVVPFGANMSTTTPLPTVQTINTTSRTVNIPPLIILEPPKDVQFRENEAIQLPCAASGNPPPVYHWLYNDAPFDPSGNDGRIALQPGVGTLIFARPIARDEAYYQCLATNIVGTALSVKINLRQAILEPFPVPSTRVNSPALGSSLTLRCTPPRSYPKANVFWAVISQDQRFSPIDLSDRVTVDPIGNLQFVNIIAEDAKNGFTYTCVAENKVMRSIQQGEYNTIRPQGVVSKLYPPAILWQSPTQQVALRGDSWNVMCVFSGNPTPRVTWLRTYGVMPLRARLESFGQTLVIDNVQSDDAGSYECQGINDEAMIPVRRSFMLSIESAPFWVDKPQSVDVGENDTATFTCRGEGLPAPTTAWLLNGVPITKLPSDPRRVAGLTDLTFYNVTIKDAQVIQCNITNKHGYNYTNAYVNVYSEPANILDGPEIGQRAAEGQTVLLTCAVYGSPKPQIVWLKGQEQLTGGRFTVMESGDLEIADVSLVDAGTYTCTAKNRLGFAQATGSLLVRRKTLIVTPPLDLMIPEGREAKLTCTGTTDPDEVQNLMIQWAKDGQIINYELAQRVYQNAIDNSLTISGTVYLDTAKYTCIATNGLDSSNASCQLIIQAVPDPPASVFVRCNSKNRSAEIWWQPGKENYAPILNFIVQYNTTFQPDLWYDIATNISQNNRRIVVTMSPFGNYTFRVISRNKIGLSLPSMKSMNVCTTEAGVPDKNPENVIGEGDQPGNLVIFWTPMPKIEHNGPDFKYIVTYIRSDLVGAPQYVTTIQQPDAWHYVAPQSDLGVYKPYRITVKAANSRGDSSANLVPVIGYSGEDIPTVRPIDVEVVQVKSATSVELRWTNIDTSPDQIRGYFRGYRIQFAKEGDDWNNALFREQDVIFNEPLMYPRPRMKRQASINDTKTYVTVNDLPPYSDVMIQVRVLTKYYAGPPSNVVQVQTPEGVSGPPKSLEVSVIGSTHFMLNWVEPDDPNGVIIGYHLSYQSITNLNLGRLQYRAQTEDANATMARLTGLNPNTTYRIYLAAETVAGIGDSIFFDSTTVESGQPDPPTFGIADFNETWANITWQPARSGTPGSVFYLQYRPRSHYEWLRSPDEYVLSYMPLVTLDPGTTYQVRVVAKNGDGFEAAAAWLEFHTPGVAPGSFHLATSGWFWGIWVSLFLVICIVVGLMIAKKYTDKKWDEKEMLIEEQVRQLQAEEAARQMGVFNQYAEPDNEFDDFKNPADFADGYDFGGGYQAAAAGPRYPQQGGYDTKYANFPEASGGQFLLDRSLDGGKKSDSYI